MLAIMKHRREQTLNYDCSRDQLQPLNNWHFILWNFGCTPNSYMLSSKDGQTWCRCIHCQTQRMPSPTTRPNYSWKLHAEPIEIPTRNRPKREKGEDGERRVTDEGVPLAGLEGELLLGHGLGVELGEGIGGAAEAGVERAVGLVQPRCGVRLPLSGHRRRRRRRSPYEPEATEEKDAEEGLMRFFFLCSMGWRCGVRWPCPFKSNLVCIGFGFGSSLVPRGWRL